MSTSNFDRSRWIRDTKLDGSIKLLLHTVVTYADSRSGICFPSYASLAAGMGVSRRTVYAAIKGAVAEGVLKASDASGTKRTYTILDEALKTKSGTGAEIAPVQKLHGCNSGTGVVPNLHETGAAVAHEHTKEHTKEQKTSAEDRASKSQKQKRETQSLPDLPASLAVGDLPKRWAEWIQHRKEIRKRLSPLQCTKQFAKFGEWGIEKSCRLIDLAITRGWIGLIDPEESSNSQWNGKSNGRREGPALVGAMTTDKPQGTTLRRNEF